MGDNYGFIPLGYSSPIANNNQSFGGGNYSGGQKFSNRNNFNNRRNNNNNHQRGNRNNNRTSNNNIAHYFHPSMLENPWDILTQNLNTSFVSNSSFSLQSEINSTCQESIKEVQPQQNYPEDLTKPTRNDNS